MTGFRDAHVAAAILNCRFQEPKRDKNIAAISSKRIFVGNQSDLLPHIFSGKIKPQTLRRSLPENAADPAWMHEKASKMAELEEEVTDLYDEWMELQ